MIPKLRPYQEDIVQRARKEIRSGRTRFILCLATGAGKTVCFCHLIRSAVAKGSKVIVFAHRKELVDQASDKLTDFEVLHNVLMAGSKKKAHSDVSVYVASTPTVARRLEKLKDFLKQFDIIIWDEAHHLAADTALRILSFCRPNAVVIGTTATPERLDGKPLGGKAADGTVLFQSLVCGPQVADLIEIKALVPVTGFTFSRPDLRGLKKRGGDYVPEQLNGLMREIVLSGSVIDDYVTHARGKRAVIFAVNIDHSKAMVAQAIARGIPAAHIDMDTPKEEREAIIGRGGKLERGEVLIVSNCSVMEEGTDCPSLEVAILTRPTCSVTKALQQMGRVLRPWCFDCRGAPKDECRSGNHHLKTEARLHDHAGILTNEKIGLPDFPRVWSLTDELPPPSDPWGALKTKVCDEMFCLECDTRAVTACLTLHRHEKCRCINSNRMTYCRRCGALLADDVQMGVSIKEDTSAVRISVEELRARRPQWAYQVDDENLKRIHSATKEEKAAEFLRLQGVAARKNRKLKWADNEFRRIFGHWPRFSDEELRVLEPAQRSFVPLEVLPVHIEQKQRGV